MQRRAGVAWGELIVPGLSLLLAGLYWLDVHDISRPHLNLVLPRIVLIAIVVCSLPLIAAAVRGRGQSGSGEPLRVTMWRLGMVGLAVAYLVLFALIGFAAASAVFIAAALLYQGVRHPLVIALVSIVGALVLYAAFAYGLAVRF